MRRSRSGRPSVSRGTAPEYPLIGSPLRGDPRSDPRDRRLGRHLRPGRRRAEARGNPWFPRGPPPSHLARSHRAGLPLGGARLRREHLARPWQEGSLMPIVALVAVTAVWGVTFVQVKDAVAIYPLFAFLAVRFVLATAVLAVPGARRVRSLGMRGTRGAAMLGLLLAAGYVLQTAGLERTTVSGTGFVTGMYVVLTPLIAVGLFRASIGPAAWAGVVVSTVGLVMLAGV